MTADSSYVDIDTFEQTIAASWGDRVRARRVELGLTQVQLADLVGIAQNHLSRIEVGKMLPREGLKTAIAHHLHVRRVGMLFPQPEVENVRMRIPTWSAA